MKNLRPLLLPVVLGAALVAPLTVFAQQANGAPAPAMQSQGQWQGRRHHGHGFMRMFKGVNLSDPQRAQMKQLMQQFRQAHPKGSRPDPRARRQLREQMMNILTPQQRTQVQQNMQQMRARRQQERDEQPSPRASNEPQA